jgi:hypothetical protein
VYFDKQLKVVKLIIGEITMSSRNGILSASLSRIIYVGKVMRGFTQILAGAR